ncbi:unnamed protein product [Musa acuminata subsp. malaccensis]|uniref:(wild Malaysian banana) hypothetical protein n=1 Tax=Musa acuminata subsp. malaccensis TaxID=214687 RepID=A0A804KJ06_MUSAM|nr:unnamed protein product [Musa acuminata subsp. malaccensis]
MLKECNTGCSIATSSALCAAKGSQGNHRKLLVGAKEFRYEFLCLKIHLKILRQ